MRYLLKIRHLYNRLIRNKKEEPRFLILISFTLTFLLARITVYGIENKFLPPIFFNYLYINDTHIHHLVYGIILLLVAGFIRIPQFGVILIRFSCILYGAGAALTLDEFAIWLKLDPNVYFGKEGRISIDAVVLFGLILLSSVWYGFFWKKLAENTIIYFFFQNQKKRFSKTLKFIYFTSKKNRLIILIIILLTIGFFVFKNYPVSISSSINIPTPSLHQVKKSVIKKIISPKKAPTLTPTLVLTSTPAPSAINSGFCLYVPVLMYHHIQPLADANANGEASLTVDDKIFDSQMSYLVSNGYTTLSADQLVDALRNKTQLPNKSILVTLDDGYEDNYKFAYPIFQKYNIKANLMIPTGLLGIHGTLNYLSWDELKRMTGSGLVFAYDHTWSHFSMSGGDEQKDQYEILTAKQQLEQNLGKPVNIFVYPYGSETPFVISLLQKDGFTGAFSTIPGTTQCDSFIMTLHRTRIGNASLSAYGF